jgi:hypothetical protein
VASKKTEGEHEIESRYSTIDLATLARQQGVVPLDFDRVWHNADFWPEDESVDEFIATIRHWREEGG